MDLINHTPYTSKVTDVDYFRYNDHPPAEINIICGGNRQGPDQKRIELLKNNMHWMDRNIIAPNLIGHWIVVTNPDDFIAKYLLDYSNLKEKDITCLGISLDSMRAKSLGIYTPLKGQHNEDLKTVKDVPLSNVTDIPFKIIRDKGFTLYGIGFVMMWFLKQRLLSLGTMTSKYNEETNQFEARNV